MINLDVAATAYFQSGPLTELVVKMLDRRTVGNDSFLLFFIFIIIIFIYASYIASTKMAWY